VEVVDVVAFNKGTHHLAGKGRRASHFSEWAKMAGQSGQIWREDDVSDERGGVRGRVIGEK
jgi:hypothetical protein